MRIPVWELPVIVFIKGPQTFENNKTPPGYAPRLSISSHVWKPSWNTEARVWTITFWRKFTLKFAHCYVFTFLSLYKLLTLQQILLDDVLANKVTEPDLCQWVTTNKNHHGALNWPRWRADGNTFISIILPTWEWLQPIFGYFQNTEWDQ